MAESDKRDNNFDSVIDPYWRWRWRYTWWLITTKNKNIKKKNFKSFNYKKGLIIFFLSFFCRMRRKRRCDYVTHIWRFHCHRYCYGTWKFGMADVFWTVTALNNHHNRVAWFFFFFLNRLAWFMLIIIINNNKGS